MKKGIVFAPAGDKPDAREFRREGRLFADMHGLTFAVLDMTGPMFKRRRRVLDALHNAGDGLEVVAFFCHGWKRGMQAGYSTATVHELARAFTMCCLPDVVVPLYCCSTAQGGIAGDGGFADMLRDEACRQGVTGIEVFGHTTPGHCARNPHVRRFAGPTPAAGGRWLVEPGTPAWHNWVALLHGPTRMNLPFGLLIARQATG